jgi:hypothetical protein
MAFFKLFPTQQYDFNRDGVLQNVIDIYRSVRPEGYKVDNTTVYKLETVQNGERPDRMSERLYGTTDYYWTFFVINEFLHDGLGVWPMSQEDLQEYMAIEFEGYALNTKTFVPLDRNTDNAITGYPNSLSGRFVLGETITGSISGAQGTLVKKDLDMGQLVIQNVTNGTAGINPITGNNDSSIIGGGFLGDPDQASNSTELLIGGTTNDSVSSHRSWKYRMAPHHYYSLSESNTDSYGNTLYDGIDPKNRPIQISENIPGTESMNNVDYITNQAYIEGLNFDRSQIKIISPKYIEQFVEEFERLINA